MMANIINFPGVPVPRTTLADLVARFADVEAQENPDADVPLASLRATDVDTIEIPGLGQHVLTDWSRGQLGHALGISWERFFAGASLNERAEDLNRRLRRAHGVVRLRTTRTKADGAVGEGMIRAVVSTDFTSVRDTSITSLLSDALRGTEPDARVIRSEVTSLSTSFVVRVGESYKIGGAGKVGEIWGGLLVRNSGVGYAKLVVSLHLTRLVCLNGLTCPVPLPAIVRARHRWLDQEQIQQSLREGLQGVGDRIRQGTYVLGESVGHLVENIDAEVRRVLKSAKLPVRLVRGVLAAYAREPHQSRFGVSQALTLAAQGESPEVRLLLEEVAGRYLASPA